MNLNIRAFLTFTLVIILGALPSLANVQGQWQLHPSADIYSYTGSNNAYNNCVKILDGERYTYFQLLSLGHDLRNDDYATTNSMLFRFDKSKESKGGDDLSPVAYEVPVSGLLVQTMNYSHEGKYLAVAYTNNFVDIIYDDGRFFSCSAIADYQAPCDKEINNITVNLDGKFFHVATRFGYVTINAEKGVVDKIVNFGTNLNYAGKVGENMVVFNDDFAYTFPASNPPAKFDSLTPLKANKDYSIDTYVNDDLSIKNPDSLYPMTDESFLYFPPRSKTNKRDGPAAVLATLTEEGEVRLVQLLNDYIRYDYYGAGKNFQYKFLNEGFITPSKEGVIYAGTLRIYQFKKGIKVDFTKSNYVNLATNQINQICSAKSTLQATTSGTDKLYLKHATYDFENFWFFYPREGFRRAKFENGAFTMFSEDAHYPNSAAAFRISSLTYNPQYGMMLRNNSDDMYYSSTSHHADDLCAFKSGNWKYYGFSKTNFDERVRNPMPKGIGVDPLDNKYIWSGSKYNGMMRQNLDDPTDILTLSRSNYTYKARPGFICVHDYFPTWSNLSNFGNVRFDADGTLWTTFFDWNLFEAQQPLSKLWFWTAEDRKASENASKDPSLYIPMGEIAIPTGSVNASSEVWPFTLPKNRNLVGLSAGHYFDGFILDHNGTPKDTSDDKVVYLNDIYDDANNKLTLKRSVYMFEDPYDNAILISYREGILVTSRDQLFNSPVKRGKILEVEYDIEGMNGRPIAQCNVTGIAIDNLGRKWISTFSDGVYCLSEDRRSLLAHYTAEKSGLPSDNCLSIAFNPETRSIWIGTDKGLAEFIPSGGQLPSFAERDIRVMPVAVHPDYMGFVKIYGLSDADEYSLSGPDGKTVFTGKPSGGMIEFHAPELTPGTYTLRDAAGTPAATFSRL